VSQTGSCCCCGSCGSLQDRPSCCSQKSPDKRKGSARSHQATGNDCTKVTGLPKPAASTTKSVKPIEVFSRVWTFVVTSSSPCADEQDAVWRWTGHSPAPPRDCVITLQRFLI
jgi:hypothetical protein